MYCPYFIQNGVLRNHNSRPMKLVLYFKCVIILQNIPFDDKLDPKIPSKSQLLMLDIITMSIIITELKNTTHVIALCINICL